MYYPPLFRSVNKIAACCLIGGLSVFLWGLFAAAHAYEPVRIGLTEIEGLAKTMILNPNQIQNVRLRVQNFSNKYPALWPRVVITVPTGAVHFMKSNYGSNKYDRLIRKVQGNYTVYTLSLVTKVLQDGTLMQLDRLEKNKGKLVEFSLKLLKKGNHRIKITVTCDNVTQPRVLNMTMKSHDLFPRPPAATAAAPGEGQPGESPGAGKPAAPQPPAGPLYSPGAASRPEMEYKPHAEVRPESQVQTSPAPKPGEVFPTRPGESASSGTSSGATSGSLAGQPHAPKPAPSVTAKPISRESTAAKPKPAPKLKTEPKPKPVAKTAAGPKDEKVQLTLKMIGSIEREVAKGDIAIGTVRITNTGSMPAKGVRFTRGPGSRGAGVETAEVLKRFDLAPSASRVIKIRYWPERSAKRVFFQLRADCSNCRVPSDLRIAFSSEDSFLGGIGLDELLIFGAGTLILLVGLLVFFIFLRGRRKSGSQIVNLPEPANRSGQAAMTNPRPKGEPELRIGPTLHHDPSPRIDTGHTMTMGALGTRLADIPKEKPRPAPESPKPPAVPPSNPESKSLFGTVGKNGTGKKPGPSKGRNYTLTYETVSDSAQPGEPDKIKLVAQVIGPTGKPAQGLLVAFTSNQGELSSNSGTTDTEGKAYVELSRISNSEQPIQTRAVCPGHPDASAELSLDRLAQTEPEAEEIQEPTISLSAEPAILNADGTSQAQIVAQITDGRGEGISGCILKLSLKPVGTDAVLSAHEIISASGGDAAFLLTAPSGTTTGSISVLARTILKNGQELVGSTEIGIDNELSLDIFWPGRTMDADGRDHETLTAVLLDGMGKPVSGVDITTRVSDPEGGVLTPDHASTDDVGKAEFVYTASNKETDCQITFSTMDYSELESQVVVTQASAHYYQVQWDDLPDSPVAKVYLSPEALEKGQGLTPDAVRHVRVLSSDKSQDYSGRVPDEAWRTVAIIGKIGFKGSHWQRYSRIARQFFNAGKTLRDGQMDELHSMADYRRHLDCVTEGLGQCLTALGMASGGDGQDDLLQGLAGFIEKVNNIKDMVGLAEIQVPEWTGDAPEVVWDRRYKEWNGLAWQENENLSRLQDLSEKLHEHWMGISPSTGHGLSGWQVAPSGDDIWIETDALLFWQAILESIDLQMKKSEVFLAELHAQVAELEADRADSQVTQPKKVAINKRRDGLDTAKNLLEQLKAQLQRELEETERRDMLARTLATK